MTEARKVNVGEAVTFVDPLRVERPALVTAVWSPTCINVVFVSGDANRNDSYGRQTEHQTSVAHVSQNLDGDGKVIGNSWK